MDPISLRIRSAAINAKARTILEEARMERRTRMAAYRALQAVRAAYELEERVCLPRMSQTAQKRWHERNAAVEADLTRMSKLRWP